MFKQVANFYWDGPLSVYQKSSMASFYSNGFTVNLWTYDNDMVAPQWANIKDASQILSKDWIGKYKFLYPETLTYEKRVYPLFSDLFRFELINKVGGWWFDLDMFCLKTSKDFFKLKLKNRLKQNKIILGRDLNTDLHATVLTSINKKTLKNLKSFIFNFAESHTDKRYGYTGPLAINSFFKGIKSVGVAAELFHPIHWDRYEAAYMPEHFYYCLEQTRGSYAYHWWNNMNEDNSILPNPDSYMGYLFAKVKEFIE